MGPIRLTAKSGFGANFGIVHNMELKAAAIAARAVGFTSTRT